MQPIAIGDGNMTQCFIRTSDFNCAILIPIN
jgi:hypothetical protein